MTGVGSSLCRRRGEDPLQRVIDFPGGHSIWRGFGNTHGDRFINSSPERLLQAYEGWVWKCIGIRADNLVKVEMKWGLRDPAGEVEPVEPTQHEGLRLLMRPNMTMTGKRLGWHTQASQDLFGRALWRIVPMNDKQPLSPDNPPAAIFSVPWQWVQPDSGDHRFVHVLKPSGHRMMFPIDQAMLWAYRDVRHPLFGNGPTLAAGEAIDLHRFSMNTNTSYFKNGARVGVTIEQGEQYDQKTVDDFYADWQTEHAGTGNAHKPSVLPHGWKVIPDRLGLHDMEFGAALNYGKEETVAMFGVPFVMMGMTKGEGRANLEAAIFAFQWGTVTPLADDRCDQLRIGFMERFYPVEGREWVCRPADFVIKDRDAERADNKAKLGEGTGIGTESINAQRQRRGDEPFDNVAADAVIVNGVALLEGGGTLILTPQPTIQQLAIAAPQAQKALEPMPDTMRAKAIWRRFKREHARSQKKIEAQLRADLNIQEKAVLAAVGKVLPKAAGMVAGWTTEKARARLKKVDDIDRVISASAETERMAKNQQPPMFNASIEGAERVYDDLNVDDFEAPAKKGGVPGVVTKQEGDDDVPIIEAEGILDFIDDLAVKELTSINETTANQIVGFVRDGIAAGKDPDQILREIRGRYKELDDSAVFSIARTLATGSWNNGQLQAAQSLDFEVVKEWIPSLDSRTRDSHRAAGVRYAQGKGIALDKDFIVGGQKLSVPADPGGGAAESRNCRCTQGFSPVE